MRTKLIIALAGAFGIAGAAIAVAAPEVMRSPVAFFSGHTHDDDGHTHGAPAHSGGTDRNGCHNGSVPYHCH